MSKKYKLTNETIMCGGHMLYRIQALKAFGPEEDDYYGESVEIGDLGGYVESEDNLSQKGNCWLYENAKAFGNAKVSQDAILRNESEISGNAKISCRAYTYGSPTIFGNAEISNRAVIRGKATICGNAKIYGYAIVDGYTSIHGNAQIYDNAQINGNVQIYDDVKIYGKVELFGDFKISGCAKIKSNKDYIVFKNSWGSGRYFAWTKSNNMWSVGCFYGTGEQLIKKAYEDSEQSGKHYEAYVKFVETLKNI